MATAIPANQAEFELGVIARVTGGELRGDPSLQCRGVAIDSRAVVPGSLFVAVEGERTDGHGFLPQAQTAGASAALVAKGSSLPEGFSCVVVEDTTLALGKLSQHHRDRWGGKVIAITGSAGKTTTKELTAGALEGLGRKVLRTPGNLNNQFGVPMTLLLLEPSHEVAVMELGTSGPGEIAYLGGLVKPDVAAVVLVAAAHTQGLGSVAAVAREKASLWGCLGETGTAVAPAGDEALQALLASHAPTRTSLFGKEGQADVQLCERSTNTAGTHLEIRVDGGEQIAAQLRLLGEPAAIDACCALACVLATEGQGAAEAALVGMGAVRPTPGRLKPYETSAGYWVIDDSYNANPESTALALSTLAELAEGTGGRAIAVLGDMRELGELSREAHEQAGELAVNLGLAILVVHGPETANTAAAAVRLAAGRFGRHPTRVVQLSARGEIARVLRSLLRPADVVLVKGSRSMGLEVVVGDLVGGEAA